MTEERKSETTPGKTHTEEKYNPLLCDVSNEFLEGWVRSPLVEDIRTVPGVDYKNANLLAVSSPAGDGITTSYQLLGVFLLCKGQGVLSAENCARFHTWLKAKGVISRTSTIVRACAEKCDSFFPGIYDGECTGKSLFSQKKIIS